jgi:hypothetical protein
LNTTKLPLSIQRTKIMTLLYAAPKGSMQL